MNTQQLQKAANFGDIALNMGQNMEIDLCVIKIGPIVRVGQKNTPKQDCILEDQSGNREQCTIWKGRTNTALAEINLNKWLTFSLSAKDYRGKPQYGGFWQMEAPVIQKPPQRPQNAPRQPNGVVRSNIQDKPDWDAIAEGKVRHGVVCAFIQAGKFDVGISIVDYWVRYIIDGKVQADEPISQETCPSCHELKVDCTCPTEPFVR